MAEEAICAAAARAKELEREWDAAGEDWREATLKRLEAWIEERERLIADFERRTGAGAKVA